MTDLFLYVVFIWVELTAVVLIAIGGFLFIGLKMKMPIILHLFRKQFIRHSLHNSAGWNSHIHVMKDIHLEGPQLFLKCKKADYIYDPSYNFFIGSDRAIAHVNGIPAPLKYSPSEGIVIETGEKYAEEIRSALTSHVMIDFNRSIYGKKDLLMFLMFGAILVMTALNMYFAYESSSQVATLNNYLAHLLNPPATG